MNAPRDSEGHRARALGEAALGRLGIRRAAAGPRSLVVRAALAVIGLAAMLVSLAVAVGASRDALEVIGHESGPQVVATADLYLALSDADTQVATVLLLGGDEPERSEAARGAYQDLRGDIAAALLRAHGLAGDDERETIESIMVGYGQYEQLAAEALLMADHAHYPAGEPPGEVLVAYRSAAELMNGQILPQAYNLTLENGTIVRGAHDDAQNDIGSGRAAVLATGLLALLCLVWLQIHLARAFRRVFNPSLLVASAVAALYLFTGLAVLGAQQDALREAKADGFDAALSLARANAVSSSLHADQVRYLLDPTRATVYEQTYFDKVRQLIYLETGNLDQYRDRIAGLDGDEPRPGLVGAVLDGDESDTGLAEAFAGLIAADERMRASGASADERLTPLDGALDDYQASMKSSLDDSLTTFETAIADGERAIADFAFLLPAAMASLTVFTISGIAPRLREFR